VDVSVVADVSILLVDVMRRFSGDYLSDAQVADAVRAVDFPHIRDIVLSLDIVRDDHGSDEQVLELFLTDPRACRVGPNPHFDEAFYQLEYPDVRSSVRDNHLHCGFFHYIKYGMREGRWPNRPTKHIALHRGSPLPLVETIREAAYLQSNPTAAAFLQSFPFVSALMHYNTLGRRLHLQIQPEETARSGINRLDVIFATIKNHFDPAFYRSEYMPGSKKSDDELLSHYIQHAGARGYSPNAFFDEKFYCAFYPEVQEAVETGQVMSGFYHYVVTGSGEGRLPQFDLKRVLDLRMPGVTTPTLLHRADDIKRRGDPIGARGRFKTIAARRGQPTIWILFPSINPDICFGGYKAAFELLIALKEDGYGVSILVTEDRVANKVYFMHRQSSQKLRDAFADIDIYTRETLQNLEIATNDMVLAYSVWDLHVAAEIASLTDRPLPYLLAQEYEPVFYDNSSVRAVCESRFAIPHYPIINSAILERYFRDRSIGVFSPNAKLNKRYSVFNHKVNRLPSGTVASMKGRTERLLALYARPEGHAARNLFEIALLALRGACEAHEFGPEWRFLGLGALSDLQPINLGGGHSLHLEQKLSEEDYVKRMSTLDIGISLMFAPHPSVVPFEFATTGALVITNTYENRSRDDLTRICKNFVPCEPSVEGVRGALREAVARVEHFEARCRDIYEPPHASWREVFSSAFIHEVFSEPRETSVQKASQAFERRMKIKEALRKSA
jgi:hypothetical protein